MRNYDNLTEKLKQAREENGLTQKDVGEKLGIASPRISYVENHPEDVTVKKLQDLLNIYDKKITITDK